MMQIDRQDRTQAAIGAMELTRAQLRILLQTDRQRMQMIAPNTFPRSKTFRWALTHPLRQWFRSGTLQGTLARIVIARLIGSRLFGKG